MSVDFISNSMHGDVLELPIVTSVMMTGFQHVAARIVKSHMASGGVHAVKRRMEFNMLKRKVDTMANHKKRFRQ